jgi:vancomycin resistance protein YoaR
MGCAVAASSSAVRARRRARARARVWPRLVTCAALAVVVAVGVGLVFAGSPDRLASHTSIAGVDVGGLSPEAARRILEQRALRLQRVPVTFVVGPRRFRVTPRQLGITVDWHAAIAAAERHGGGFGFVRGYRRLELELFPEDLSPPVHAYDAAVAYEVARFAKAVDQPHREASLVRRGLHISIQPGRTGRELDRAAARKSVVAALASFSRKPVTLPVRVVHPRVTVASLTPAQRAAAQVIAAPVTVLAGKTRIRVPRWRLATMLSLPSGGSTAVRFGGAAADAELARLARMVTRPSKNADWAVASDGHVYVVPGRAGTTLVARPSAARILAAAKRPRNRLATLVLAEQPPARTTAEARALGITGTVGSYETFYGGDSNRIHNVQLVAHLVDRKLIAPGTTFSFNGTTGERSAAKGFLEAPVIINGELQTGLGGGVCQVSTTVFNAAFEAGLPITARTNHALYISHYPLGRDATVDYPSVDLKFVNDTGHWLLLRTWVGSSSLTVALYGAPQHRRVESETAPLTVVGAPPVERTVDATLDPGDVVVDDRGAPAQTTSVERKVYAASGKLLSDQTWRSYYRAEPKIVRVGPKKPKKKPKPPAGSPTTTTPTHEPPH